jgi:lauroyl/myristoyl acyltransferase
VTRGAATLAGLRLALWLARWLPLRTCASCGAAGGWLAGWLSPHHRLVAANLRIIASAGEEDELSRAPGRSREEADAPASGPHSRPLVAGRRSVPPRPSSVFAAYGRYWGEFLALAARPERLDELAVRVEGEENLRAAAARGPVCAFTGHLGNWDMAARLMARRLPCFAVVAEELEPAGLFRFFVKAREEAGCPVIPAERGGLRLYRHLRGGGHVGIVADRVFGAGSRGVPFLGGVREFPAAGMDLARRAGATLVPVFLVREESAYCLRIHPELPPGTDPVGSFARVLESEIRTFAAQYCLLYPLHSSAPGPQAGRVLPVERKAATA